MKKVQLKQQSDSESAQYKRAIQDVAREIVIIRDGGCILRDIYGIPSCNGFNKDGELILQADHLITRGNSATYADTRLIVCLCKGHHGWKSVGSNVRKAQYDAILKKILPPDRVSLWERCELASWKPTPMRTHDWKLALVALEQELIRVKRLKTLSR